MWFVVKGGWPQMILLFLIMRWTPTIRELIEATPLSPSSPSATSLSALAPAQRAGAQRLCAVCRFLGRRNDVTLHALMRPAFEKRQGTKSRSVVHRRCGGRYRELTDAHELEAE